MKVHCYNSLKIKFPSSFIQNLKQTFNQLLRINELNNFKLNLFHNTVNLTSHFQYVQINKLKDIT